MKIPVPEVWSTDGAMRVQVLDNAFNIGVLDSSFDRLDLILLRFGLRLVHSQHRYFHHLMARLKKDKKAAASSTDLHKFFGLAPHPKASKSAPEIIVISDDEEDLPKTKLKRTLEGDQRSVNKRTRVRSLPAEDNFASRSTLTKDSSSQVIITLDGDDDCGTRNANGDTAFPVGDDWEMGDDESGAQEDSVDASESETLGSTSPGTSGKLNTCPVCGKGFLKQLVSVSTIRRCT